MTIACFVGRLARSGAWFSLAGENIKYHGPQRLLTDKLRAFVEAHRGGLMAFLRKTEDQLTDTELDTLGYVRPDHGGPIFTGSEDPYGEGWAPPPDWDIPEPQGATQPPRPQARQAELLNDGEGPE